MLAPTLEVMAKMGWEVLPHPSYSPDLAPFDYHLFGFVKDQLRGQHYETTEAIHKAVRQRLRMAGTEFYRRGIFQFRQQCVSIFRWLEWNFTEGEFSNSDSSASASSDGWNGILQKGNFQTPGTLGEMCTKKWRLCGKIKKGL